MNNKVKVEPEEIDLRKLKKLLRHGDMKRIAEKTGYSSVYVSQVLNPNVPERYVPDIVVAAVKLVQDKVKVEVDADIAASITKNGADSVRKSQKSNGQTNGQ